MRRWNNYINKKKTAEINHSKIFFSLSRETEFFIFKFHYNTQSDHVESKYTNSMCQRS